MTSSSKTGSYEQQTQGPTDLNRDGEMKSRLPGVSEVSPSEFRPGGPDLCRICVVLILALEGIQAGGLI